VALVGSVLTRGNVGGQELYSHATSWKVTGSRPDEVNEYFQFI
jgi:hypothetical protein